jgi:hypothetical protein
MFFVTTATNHPTGAGYFEIHTDDYSEANKACFDTLGEKWCFLYNDINKLHELDRIKLGEIYVEEDDPEHTGYIIFT